MMRAHWRSVPSTNPIHAILLAFPIALFPSALASDFAFFRTAVIQWSNFSAWLVAGAVLFTGIVLAWALIKLLIGPDRKRGLVYTLLVALLFVVGFVNALKHSQDAWSSVDTLGIILSIVCTVLALIAGFIAYGSHRIEEHVHERIEEPQP